MSSISGSSNSYNITNSENSPSLTAPPIQQIVKDFIQNLKEIDEKGPEQLNRFATKLFSDPITTNLMFKCLFETDDPIYINYMGRIIGILIDDLSVIFFGSYNDETEVIIEWLRKNKNYFTEKTISSLSDESVIQLTALLAQLPKDETSTYREIFNLLDPATVEFFHTFIDDPSALIEEDGNEEKALEKHLHSILESNSLSETSFLFKNRILICGYYLSFKKYNYSQIKDIISPQDLITINPYLLFGYFDSSIKPNELDSLLTEFPFRYIIIEESLTKKLPSSLASCHLLHLYNCDEIKILPPLPNCKEIYLAECHNLRILSELPSALTVTCLRCPSLIWLPAQIPQCKSLICTECFGLEGMLPITAEDSEVIITQLDAPYTEFYMRVDVDELTSNPRKVLLELGEILLEELPFPINHDLFPQIIYMQNGEELETLDAGGVRRDLLSRLMLGLFREEKTETTLQKDKNGWPVQPCLQKNRYGWPLEVSFHEESTIAYRILGRLFALCYPSNSFLKPGFVFPETFYEALAEIIGNKDDLIVVYLIRMGINAEVAFVCHDQTTLSNLSDDTLINAAYLYDVDSDWTVEEAKKLFEDLTNRTRLADNILKKASVDPLINPLKIIAEEMQQILGPSGWDLICKTTNLMERIQGALDANTVLNAISAEKGENVTDQDHDRTIGFLVRWIQEADSEQLRQFVYAMTGNNAIGNQTPLIIQTYNREEALPVAHTCSFELELSAQYPTQEVFNQKLELFLTYALNGAAFDSY